MTPDLNELEWLLKEATQGKWEVDSIACDGEFGEGDDLHEGFSAYEIRVGGKRIIDTAEEALRKLWQERVK
jgi:hypothetical protein